MIHTLLLLIALSEQLPNVFEVIYFKSSSKHYIQLYKEAGVLEEHEIVEGRFFKYPVVFYRNIETMQMRLSSLDANTPEACDEVYLPPADTCWSYYREADKYKDWLLKKVQFAHPVELDALHDNINNTEWRRLFWSRAYYIRQKVYSDTSRRKELQTLIEMIGKDNYYKANFPEPLPPSGYEEFWK